MPSSTAPSTYRRRLAAWNRAVTRARLMLARARLTREQRKRARVVAVARWGVAHTSKIHYAETRPIPVQPAGKLPALPLRTDCSGWATVCYRAAAAPDPNENGYNGQGFTGTLLLHGRKVAHPEPGDVVVYGPAPGHHAAVVVKGGADPLTVSHGSEAGPLYITVDAERRYQPAGVTYLRFPVV